MFRIFIDNEEVVCESNFEIKEEFMNPSSVELYKVFPKSWKGTDKLLTDYYYPDDYTKCNIYKDDSLYFTGIVKNSADMVLNPFKPHYCSLQILDPSTLLSEGSTLDYVIVNKTVEEAIKQVINSISHYGFIVGNINIPEADNTIIGAYSTLDKAPFDVLNYLSMISGCRWGTRMIDENTIAVDFFGPELLDNCGTLECTREYFKNNKIEELNYDYSTTDYRNKQIITSDEIFGNIPQTQTVISNGYQNSFFTEQKIGSIVSIYVNDIEKTIASKLEKENGVTADFYYELGSSTFDSDIVYPAGTNIVVKYIPLIKGREIAYNNNEIARINYKLGRNGIISRYENRNDVKSSSELLSIGKSYIKFKGVAEVILSIISRVDFLKLGNKYSFVSPVEKLNSNYLVKSKNTKIFQNDDVQIIKYEYELTNTFDTENEINYFDNQRAKANGNISQGEYISRNIDIENTANIIFSDLQITEISIEKSNVLEAPLEVHL